MDDFVLTTLIEHKNTFDTFAVLSSTGIILYASPKFLKKFSVSINEHKSETHIKNLLSPLKSTGPSWYKITGRSGDLLQDAGGDCYTYKVEAIGKKNEIGCTLLILFQEKFSFLYDIYDYAFELNPGLSAITEADTGVHLDVNKAWLRAMEYKKREVIGKTAEELMVWVGGQEERKKIIEKLMEYGRLESYEAKMRSKGGKIIDVVINSELVVHSGKKYSIFSSNDITSLKKAVIDRARLEYESKMLSQIAFIDGLTGIPNRRHFDEMLKTEWNKCGRNLTYLSVIMLDIDYFKLYNDFYGHITGDDCLKKVAGALHNSLKRAGDIFCRFGGEEFCCILPNCDIEGGLKVAERLMKTIEILNLPHEGSPLFDRVTISIGIASMIPDCRKNTDILLQKADSNLYLAKKEGRNRIIGR